MGESRWSLAGEDGDQEIRLRLDPRVLTSGPRHKMSLSIFLDGAARGFQLAADDVDAQLSRPQHAQCAWCKLDLGAAKDSDEANRLAKEHVLSCDAAPHKEEMIKLRALIVEQGKLLRKLRASLRRGRTRRAALTRKLRERRGRP